MSHPHNEHESAIKTPKQLLMVIFASFAVPIICIVLLVIYVTGDKLTGAGSDSQSPEAVAARIRPVAEEGFTLKDANAPKSLQSGEAVYNASCGACHNSGAANAPKFANNADWGSRIATGYESLVKNAINGVRGMPAKGGNPDLDDVEIARAVVYMANAAGAKFKEPEAAAAAPAAAAGAESSPANETPSTPAY